MNTPNCLPINKPKTIPRGTLLRRDEKNREKVEKIGEKRGEEKGRIKGTIAMIILLLKERFEKVPENEIATQLEGLSLADLEGLVKAVLRFNNLDDLSKWLADR